MPTKQPIIQVVLTAEIAAALKAKAGKQKLSAYIRKLIEIDLGIEGNMQHGGNRYSHTGDNNETL